MLNNRQKVGLSIIVIGLVILLVIIYLSFFRNQPQKLGPKTNKSATTTAQLPNQPQINTTTPGDKLRNYQKYDISQEPKHELNKNDLEKLAMSFSERLGSYSNQSNYNNFTDLKIFMTTKMKLWADRYVNKLKQTNNNNSNYFGVSTKALLAKVEEFDAKDGRAEVIVTTQRQESTAKVDDNKTYIQKIDISLRKVHGSWLVDKAYWQK